MDSKCREWKIQVSNCVYMDMDGTITALGTTHLTAQRAPIYSMVEHLVGAHMAEHVAASTQHANAVGLVFELSEADAARGMVHEQLPVGVERKHPRAGVGLVPAECT
jgi:hypothetical protein